jgi:fatty acid amide hydrolase 2
VHHTILDYSATELALKIKSKEISSYEVVSRHIERAKKVNPKLNAIVQERYDLALDEAKNCDRRLSNKSTSTPLFFGVPCTLKENFAFKGYPQTGGLVSRKNNLATENATCVQRILDAGAIVIGTTNVSELCMWMESNNKVYGRTNNPYSLERIVGGSSGGEGAIIGSGASPFGLGADIGGSIRMPAFFNGVFGHKPSGGLVPGSGQYPMAQNQALRYLTTGPICRRAQDLKPLVRLLSGSDGLDKGVIDYGIDWEEKLDFTNLEVISVPENGFISVSNELKDAQLQVLEYLKEKGAKIRNEEFPELKQSFEIWSSMLSSAGGPTFEELLFEDKPYHLPIEILKSLFGESDFTIPGLGLAALEKLPKLFPGNAKNYVGVGTALKEKFNRVLNKNTILLYPSYSSTAPYHNEPIFKAFDWVYTAIINVMELPSTQVPLGLSKEGLPLGIQVISNSGRDIQSINVAIELEKKFGGWLFPENI